MPIRELPTLSDSQSAECERRVRQFEAEWKLGREPDINDHLPNCKELRPVLLVKLVRLELNLRRSKGERVQLDSYFERFPELKSVRGDFSSYDDDGDGSPLDSPDETPTSLAEQQHLSVPDLLCGVLAFRMQFVSKDELIGALEDWLKSKDRPLIDIFSARSNLSPARRELLEAVVAEHLQKDAPDPEKSLMVIETVQMLGPDLKKIGANDLLVDQKAVLHPVGTRTFEGSRFRIVRPHCKGGLGQISVALDEELHREVALKEIQGAHGNDSRSRERFLLEAEITGSLEHPGVVPVYGFGRYADGRPYYAMRFIKGDTLKSAIQDFHRPDHHSRNSPGQRQLELRKLLARFIDVCNTIEYAHSRGVIHRDLKPSNIMLGKYGETLVVDWGLAKMVGRKELTSDEITLRALADNGSSIETLPGSVLGTPAFMSPEQASGRLENLGPPTDIYSLGATLYNLLTGIPPFDFQAGNVIQRVQLGDFPRPRQANADVPPGLEAICLKAMALKAADRYRSPTDLADDLEHWLADEPVSALRDTPVQRLGRIARRHRTVAIMGGGALAVVTVVSLVAAVITNGHLQVADRERQRAEESLKIADTLRESEKKQREQALSYADAETIARQTAEQTIIDLGVTLGLAAHNERLHETALLWFGEAARAAAKFPERELANRVRFTSWRRIVPYPVRAFAHSTAKIKELAFSPDGGYLLVVTDQSGCVVWNLETSRKLSLPDSHLRAASATWNRAGNQLVYGTENGEIELLSFPACESRMRLNGTGPIEAVAFSPDDRLLAIASDEVALWNCSTQSYQAKFSHPAAVKKLIFNPPGDLLATVCEDNRVRVFQINNASTESNSSPILPPLPNHRSLLDSNDLVYPIFLGHGDILVTHAERGLLEFTDLRRKETLQQLKTNPLLEVNGFVASPDEQRLIVYGSQSTTTYDVSERTAKSGQHEFRHKSWITSCLFSPNGQIVLTTGADRTARFWPSVIPPGTSTDELFTTIPHENNVTSGVFSANGRFIATAQSDGLVRVWTTHGNLDRRIETGTQAAYLVRVNSSGAFGVSAGWRWQRGVTRTRAFSTETGAPVGPWLQAKGALNDAAFSPDDQHLITLSSSVVTEGLTPFSAINLEQQGYVQFWNWRTGNEVLEPIVTDAEPIRAIFSPTKETAVVFCVDGVVLVIDGKTGQKLHVLRHPGKLRRDSPPPQQMIRFSADGDSFATYGLGNEARVWSCSTGKSLARLPLGDLCWDVDFSPQGDRVATASFDNTSTIWDLNTQQPVVQLQHPDRVHCVRFSPDGTRLATSCRDRMTRIWDWATARMICPPVQHSDEGWIARFTPDGRWILTDSRSNYFRAWDAFTGKPVTPPIPIERSQGIIEMSADGKRVILAGAKIHIFELSRLLSSNPENQSLDEIGLLGEILSGRKIVPGGGVVNLSTAEWLERWERHPLRPLNEDW